MEVMLDELQKNEIDIDMDTLSYHINDCLDRYKSVFQKGEKGGLTNTKMYTFLEQNPVARTLLYTYVI